MRSTPSSQLTSVQTSWPVTCDSAEMSRSIIAWSPRSMAAARRRVTTSWRATADGGTRSRSSRCPCLSASARTSSLLRRKPGRLSGPISSARTVRSRAMSWSGPGSVLASTMSSSRSTLRK